MRRLLAALLLLSGAVLLPAGQARAADYVMTTAATYAVKPDDRGIDVSVAIDFTNTTPDPAGQFSVFDEIQLAVQDGATDLAASDGDGDLEASLAVKNDVNVATITLRDGLRFEDSVELTMTYRLPDGGADGLRVRPSAVVFQAWSFGTGGTVTVQVPAGYEVRSDGDPLTAATSPQLTTLTSGQVADPRQWLALVIATSETEFVTTARTVPLDGGTVDLQVRAFDDDAAWGESTAELLAEALPLLQAELGLEYRRQGPVIVTEAVDVGTGDGIAAEPTATTPELVIGFDQDPFTVVHQAAHLWVTDQVASERWIREGLASWAAARVAPALEVTPPYDAAARTAELADVAFPLESWGAGEATAEQDAYGYAASWAFTNELVSAVQPDRMRTVLQRIVAGRSAYDPISEVEPEPGAVPVLPVDSRRFLDHLEAIAGVDLASRFAEVVFAEGIPDELAARAAARTSYAALISKAGDWGPPLSATTPMAAWDFATAETAMDDASAWLDDRDALVTDIAAGGLTTPNRLRDRYAEFGGGPEADAELSAERAVVDAYRTALEASVQERGIVERIGLIADADPAAVLVRAHGAFGEGDLERALAEARHAQALLDGAQTAGIVRLVSSALVLAVGLAAAIWLLRRRRAAAG
jgi:hypothetical protein